MVLSHLIQDILRCYCNHTKISVSEYATDMHMFGVLRREINLANGHNPQSNRQTWEEDFKDHLQSAYLSGLAGGLRGSSCKWRRNIANIWLKVGRLDALNCKHSPIIFHNSLGIPTPTTLAYCGGNFLALTTARYISWALNPDQLHSKHQLVLQDSNT